MTSQLSDMNNNQATLNIGVIGYLGHGKSTVVKSISGVKTSRYKSELERVLTIKLGYANAKIYKCDNEDVGHNKRFTSRGSSHPEKFPCDQPKCNGTYKLISHVSFIDCPGQKLLLSTMLTGTPVMDAVLLVVAGEDLCHEMFEHLAAIEMKEIKPVVILQNKTDLLSEANQKSQEEKISEIVSYTIAHGAPIIPVSAHYKLNIDTVCQYIAEEIPMPLRDLTSEPKFIVIRSFNINKSGCTVADLKGGVLGGSLVTGIFKVGMEIEIRPGFVSKDSAGSVRYSPLLTRIMSLYSETTELQIACPGGLIGVGTKLDPILCKQDRMVGQVVGSPGILPDVYIELVIKYFLMRKVLGGRPQERKKIQRLCKNEILVLNIGSLCIGGSVVAVKGDQAKLVLSKPTCSEIGERITLVRRIDGEWRLIGYGTITKGTRMEPNVK